MSIDLKKKRRLYQWLLFIAPSACASMALGLYLYNKYAVCNQSISSGIFVGTFLLGGIAAAFISNGRTALSEYKIYAESVIKLTDSIAMHDYYSDDKKIRKLTYQMEEYPGLSRILSRRLRAAKKGYLKFEFEKQKNSYISIIDAVLKQTER